MTTDLLAADTAMGAVTLNVGDLDGMTAYYRDAVGLDILDGHGLAADGPRVVLGRGTRAVVVLEHTPELRHASPHDAGLFHTAIVFDSQAALAAAVYSVAARIPDRSPGRATTA